MIPSVTDAYPNSSHSIDNIVLETETHQCQHQFRLLILQIWAHLLQIESGLVIVDFLSGIITPG